MASQDTTDSVYLHTVTNNDQFQERCWLRFLIAAFAVTTEAITAPVTAVTAAGAATLTFAPATPASITGLVAINLTAPLVIPVGAKVASVTATTAVLDHNVIGAGVAIGDSISFAPAAHAERATFAGALFAKNVNLMMLANAVLADATNRANCLADKTLPGGNVTDAGIDTQVNAIFTGLAKVRNW
jgi:hypothetical protein